MDVKKTATDTAYIVVGVGVLGFQQAQVRRRDAAARVSTLRRDARGALGEQAGKLKAATGGCETFVGGLGAKIGAKGTDLTSSVTSRVSTAGSTVSSTVTNTVGSVGSTVGSTVSNTVGAVGSQVKAGAGAARAADPRGWVDPVVGDLRLRVEPVVEQLRTITLPGTVSSLPDQVSKVIEVGRNRVQGRLGNTAAPPRAAATGT